MNMCMEEKRNTERREQPGETAQKVYDVAIMLAGGGSNELTLNSTVLVYYIYEKAFVEWKLGYSSAIAMVLFVLVLVVTIIQFRGQKKYASS